MILHSLYKLYDRLADDEHSGITPVGFSPQKISFRIVIKPDGELFSIAPVSDTSSKKSFLNQIVPEHQVRAGPKILPQFLCDKANYCLGIDPKTGVRGKFEDHFNAFKKLHLSAEADIQCKQYSSFCRFLEKWDIHTSDEFHKTNPNKLSKCINFGIFEIQGESIPIHEIPEIQAWWNKQEPAEAPIGQCLITGELQALARLHPKIKGFASAASLVGVQKNTSYESYTLKQALTAPTSEKAAFKYASALNWMLDGNGRAKHRIYIADTSCVFWTDAPSIIEDFAPMFFADPSDSEKAQDESVRLKLELFLKILRKGSNILTDLGEKPQDTNFYLLGIEQPNPGRFSIRFFLQSSVAEFIENLRKHQSDISIVREHESATQYRNAQPEFPSNKDLINQTAVKLSSGKLDFKTIPPMLGGALTRAILENTPYPEGIYSAVLRRIRADRTINYFRAAIIKGVLTRNHKQTISTMLDTENKEPAYLLGRLFAIFEQSQRQAHEFKLDRTIRESFFSSASATPNAIYPRLHKLHIHHLRKLGKGSQKFYEDLICEVLGKIETDERGNIQYPTTLTLIEQGVFSIGYYHQLVPLKTKKDKATDSTESL